MDESIQNKLINLENFEKIRSIGSGTFSKVFLVKKKGTNSFYAAKVLNTAIDDDNEGEQANLYIYREIKLFSSLNHPSILGFIGFSRTKCKKIEEYTFYGCEKLTKVQLPSSITFIGESSFQDCISFGEKINIPNSTTTIKEQAFYKCSSLIEVTIPSSAEKIGDCCFGECTSLKKASINSNIINNISNELFYNCNSLTSFSIPSSVIVIGLSSFAKCRSIKNLNLPESLISIGNYAFQNCVSLMTINFPSSLKYIGNDIFEDCPNSLDKLIPSNVTFIYGGFAFRGCISLDKNKVIIPPGANCQENTFDEENPIIFHKKTNNSYVNITKNKETKQKKCNIY